MPFFNDKVILITGSSNGIGRATARMFASHGTRLTITGRNPSSLEKTKKLCLEAGIKNCDLHEVLGEIESEETRVRLIEETIKKFGKLDVLVNSAGMAVDSMVASERSPVDAPLSHYDQTMAVNIRAIIHLVQLAVPHLEKTRGAIVNVSSVAGFPFAMTEFYYPISKAALDQLTVQLAGELINKGIRVNSVNPGPVATAFLRMRGETEDESRAAFEEIGKMPKCIPIGRCGQPEDIAKLILFLADRSQSEFIVGQRIVIDGGALLQNVLFRTQ